MSCRDGAAAKGREGAFMAMLRRPTTSSGVSRLEKRIRLFGRSWPPSFPVRLHRVAAPTRNRPTRVHQQQSIHRHVAREIRPPADGVCMSWSSDVVQSASAAGARGPMRLWVQEPNAVRFDVVMDFPGVREKGAMCFFIQYSGEKVHYNSNRTGVRPSEPSRHGPAATAAKWIAPIEQP